MDPIKGSYDPAGEFRGAANAGRRHGADRWLEALSRAALLALGIGVAPGVFAADQGIVGTWRLVSYEDRPASGEPVFPFGTHPGGQLIYDAGGNMSIQIMKQPHPGVASGDEERVTPQEKEALFDAYVAYYGRYTVNAAKGVVVHHVEGDMYDVYIGRDEERPFELAGDRLILTPRWMQGGQEWTGIRIFERVR